MHRRLLTSTILALGLALPVTAAAQQAAGDSPAGKQSQQELQTGAGAGTDAGRVDDRSGASATQSGDRAAGQAGQAGSSAGASSAGGGGQLDPATQADRRTWSRDKLVGKPLFGADGDRIGEIEEVVAGPAGEVEAILVDVGGFLGIGSKQVAVPIEELSLYEDRAVAAGLTEAEAKSYDEYDPGRKQ